MNTSPEQFPHEEKESPRPEAGHIIESGAQNQNKEKNRKGDREGNRDEDQEGNTEEEDEREDDRYCTPTALSPKPPTSLPPEKTNQLIAELSSFAKMLATYSGSPLPKSNQNFQHLQNLRNVQNLQNFQKSPESCNQPTINEVLNTDTKTLVDISSTKISKTVMVNRGHTVGRPPLPLSSRSSRASGESSQINALNTLQIGQWKEELKEETYKCDKSSVFPQSFPPVNQLTTLNSNPSPSETNSDKIGSCGMKGFPQKKKRRLVTLKEKEEGPKETSMTHVEKYISKVS